jgi:hypothetical protein
MLSHHTLPILLLLALVWQGYTRWPLYRRPGESRQNALRCAKESVSPTTRPACPACQAGGEQGTSSVPQTPPPPVKKQKPGRPRTVDTHKSNPALTPGGDFCTLPGLTPCIACATIWPVLIPNVCDGDQYAGHQAPESRRRCEADAQARPKPPPRRNREDVGDL